MVTISRILTLTVSLPSPPPPPSTLLQLSDFGLARGSGGTAAFDDMPSTRGAAAKRRGRPRGERGDAVQPTLQMEKVDVYGFGVVLLELITGQKAMKEVHITSVVSGRGNHF